MAFISGVLHVFYLHIILIMQQSELWALAALSDGICDDIYRPLSPQNDLIGCLCKQFILTYLHLL